MFHPLPGDDFREADGHVLMIVCFQEAEPDAPQHRERQSWIVDLTGDPPKVLRQGAITLDQLRAVVPSIAVA